MEIRTKLLPRLGFSLPRFWLPVLICLLPALAGVQAATDKEFKREDPFFSPARTAFPCEGDSTLTVAADGDSTIFSSTTALSLRRLNGYSCVSWPERGPEMIFRLDVADTMQFWAGLLDDGNLDLDVFLLRDCNSDACLEGANVEVSGNIGPLGTYFLVVDGYSYDYDQVGGPFTLGFEGRPIGLPQGICDDPDQKMDLVSFAANPDSLFEGDLFDQPNLLQSYDCSPYLERGGEVWFQIPAWQASGFKVSVTPYANPALDLALWLFADCGTEAVCLDFADDYTGGKGESLTWTSSPGDPDLIYLGVDSTQMPGSGALDGDFILSFGSTIELLGVPMDICMYPDYSLDFEALAANPDSVFTGDLYAKPNLLEEYEPCGPALVRGGEIWFEIPSWQAASFTANVATTAPGLDLALCLVGACGPEATCLAFADDNPRGQGETLTWIKLEGGPTSVFLGVDCSQAPSAADSDGLFTLTFGDTIVEAERTSWGGLRALFR